MTNLSNVIGSATTIATHYATVTLAEAAIGHTNNEQIYVEETESFYSYESAGSAFTRDGLYILNTIDGGDTRFKAIAGKYIYDNVYRSSIIAGNSSIDGSIELYVAGNTTNEHGNFRIVRLPNGNWISQINCGGGSENWETEETLATVCIATTIAPTTEAPTTLAPTTEAPTTLATTTEAPTTEAPTTETPTTEAPTTEAPTTEAPTTAAPSYSSDKFTGGTADCSATEYTTYTADKAFDNLTTVGNQCWMQSAPEQWVEYDLGAGNEEVFRKFRCYPGFSFLNDIMAEDITFKGQEDGSGTWDTLTTITGMTAKQYYEATFSNTTGYRKIRCYIDVTGIAGWSGICELEGMTIT